MAGASKRLIQFAAWAIFVSALIGVPARPGDAQEPQKASGRCRAILPDGFLLVTQSGALHIVVSDTELQSMMSGKGKVLSVLVTGEAEPNYITKDMYVNFSADLVDGKPGPDEIDQITIFTPDATHPGFEAIAKGAVMGDDEGAAPRTGSYIFSGVVQSFQASLLKVKVPGKGSRPQPLTFHVSEKAKVSVRTQDYTMAKPDDMIEVEGFSKDPKENVTMIVAEKVSINGVKPWINAKAAKQAQAQAAARLKDRSPRKDAGKTRGKVAREKADETDAAAEAVPEPSTTRATAADAMAAANAAPAPDMAMAGAASDGARRSGEPTPETLIITDAFSVDDPPAATATKAGPGAMAAPARGAAPVKATAPAALKTGEPGDMKDMAGIQ